MLFEHGISCSSFAHVTESTETNMKACSRSGENEEL